MRLLIAAAGRARGGPEADIAADYLTRASRLAPALGLSGPALREVEPERRARGAKKSLSESTKLFDATANARRALLDERGGELSSEALAAWIAQTRDGGAPALAFLIGGADGFDDDARARADRLIAFGKATWPHMLVRAMAAEQLYRAMTILAGHPYHRA